MHFSSFSVSFSLKEQIMKKMGAQNPWTVENIEAFSFYCCLECDFKSKKGDYFKKHAMESHNKSKVFLELTPKSALLSLTIL